MPRIHLDLQTHSFIGYSAIASGKLPRIAEDRTARAVQFENMLDD
jgi:hypothetical protein